MIKLTLTVASYDNIPKSYDVLNPPSKAVIWNKIIENVPKNKRYIDHIEQTEWIEDPNLEHYKVANLSIPCGTLIYKVDVILEDK